MDEDINMQWVQGTLIQELGIKKKTTFYFASNKVKHSMKHAEIRSTLQLTCYLKNHTDKIQPIDAGCGRMMKIEIGTGMETWLEEENNLNK